MQDAVGPREAMPHFSDAALHLQDPRRPDRLQYLRRLLDIRLVDSDAELAPVQDALERLGHVVHDHYGDAAVQDGVDVAGGVPVAGHGQTELGAGQVLRVVPLVLSITGSNEDAVLLAPTLLVGQPALRLSMHNVTPV